MALIQMNILSQSLMRTVPVNVILPVDKLPMPGMPVREDKPYKTLYLLHGVFGGCNDWCSQTRIQMYAEENDLAVVMPAGENMFYVDQPKCHNNYGEFVGRELVELTRRMFPLSRRREDTFIGGLSMGGYGAIRNGLKYSETFGAVVALSAALVLEDQINREPGGFFLNSRDYGEAIWGDVVKAQQSDANPKWLVKKLREEGKALPEFFMATGDEDSLLGVDREFAEFLKENGVPVHFEVGPGNHEWYFWDTYIKKAVYEWLPTEKNGQGIHSGNIGQ